MIVGGRPGCSPLALLLCAACSSVGSAPPPSGTASSAGGAAGHGGWGGAAGAGGGGVGGSGGEGGAACDKPPGPPLVNALVRDKSVLALYPVAEAPGGAVAFEQQGAVITALGAGGGELWSAEVGEGALFGGFDFDQDGWPDLGLVQQATIPGSCGSYPLKQTWITFVHGKTGKTEGGVSPTSDKCWQFNEVVYPTEQWTTLGVLFGAGGDTITVVPYYADTGWFFRWTGGTWQSEAFLYPSTPSFDQTYAADQPNAYNNGASYIANSHVANGMMLEVDGARRLVFFTSGRVVQYAVAPLGPSQLLFDHPFLSGGRTDIAGRDYGLVARDPSYPDHLALISGTDSMALYLDMVNGAPGSDDWGQIERHVTIYDLRDNGLEDRFFSYAHDGGDAYQYEGRVAYPDSAFVRSSPAAPSRLAFNVLSAGVWSVHLTVPGGTADARVWPGLYLWDVRDLDGDGVDEWVTSPAPDGYLPSWHTDLWRFAEADVDLEPRASYPGTVPLHVAAFREPARTTSRSFLYPTLVVASGCDLAMLGRDQAGTTHEIVLP